MLFKRSEHCSVSIMKKTVYTFDPSHVEHTTSGHPEQKGRLERVWSVMSDAGLTDQLVRLETPEADMSHIKVVHSTRYIDHLHYMVHQGLSYLDPDTYCTQHSLEVALRGVGGLLNITDAVLSGKADNGMALLRPPGHHARPHAAMGFCLFGNVAIAAKYAQRKYGLEKILVLDFDVHHGNGTQEMLYDDPNILFMSVHGAPPFYPESGFIQETGREEGEGYTVNVPLLPGAGDETYQHVFQRVFEPLVARFRPQAIFVSAGYDAHWMDPMAHMHVSTAGFNAMILALMSWADQYAEGRLVATLEGGYHVNALAHSVTQTLTLLNNPDAKLEDPFGPYKDGEMKAEELINSIAHFWRV